MLTSYNTHHQNHPPDAHDICRGTIHHVLCRFGSHSNDCYVTESRGGDWIRILEGLRQLTSFTSDSNMDVTMNPSINPSINTRIKTSNCYWMKDKKEEGGVCSGCGDANGNVKRWMVTLFELLTYNPPCDVIQSILNLLPNDAVQMADPRGGGWLLLHEAIYAQCNSQVIELILHAYPGAASVPVKHGSSLPLDLALTFGKPGYEPSYEDSLRDIMTDLSEENICVIRMLVSAYPAAALVLLKSLWKWMNKNIYHTEIRENLLWLTELLIHARFQARNEEGKMRGSRRSMVYRPLHALIRYERELIEMKQLRKYWLRKYRRDLKFPIKVKYLVRKDQSENDCDDHTSGDNPTIECYCLHKIIEKGLKWNPIVEEVYNAAPFVASIPDNQSGLYPFMVAACNRHGIDEDGGDLNCSYELLRKCPIVLKTFT